MKFNEALAWLEEDSKRIVRDKFDVAIRIMDGVLESCFGNVWTECDAPANGLYNNEYTREVQLFNNPVGMMCASKMSRCFSENDRKVEEFCRKYITAEYDGDPAINFDKIVCYDDVPTIPRPNKKHNLAEGGREA